MYILNVNSSPCAFLTLNQGEDYFRAAREVARLYHEKGSVEEAKSVMEDALEKHPSVVEPIDLNLLLELHLILGG